MSLNIFAHCFTEVVDFNRWQLLLNNTCPGSRTITGTTVHKNWLVFRNFRHPISKLIKRYVDASFKDRLITTLPGASYIQICEPVVTRIERSDVKGLCPFAIG